MEFLVEGWNSGLVEGGGFCYSIAGCSDELGIISNWVLMKFLDVDSGTPSGGRTRRVVDDG